MTKRILFCLLLFVGFGLSLNAQTADSKWGIMLSGGKMEYNGDIGSNMIFGQPFQGHFGGRLGYYLSPRLDLFLAGSSGRHGIDETNGGTNPADQFLSDVFQMNLGLHYKLAADKKFTPFLSGALGYINYKNLIGEPDDPAQVGVPRGEDESNLHIPLGLGFRYNITDNFGLFWHSQYGLNFGDNYDGAYPGSTNFPNAEDGNDNYLLHELGLGFSFGKKDRDKDGVADKDDLCPDIPGLEELDGCPDKDMDGITDAEDDCPDVAGLEKYRGCPDRDGDGVIDKNDTCPDDAGEAQYNGCPDTDSDGVPDNIDECVEETGLARYNGCPIPDSDGDGFNDEDDECPNTKGDLRGCPDGDGDGVQDRNDDCPETAGTVKGCPDQDDDGIADKDDKCPTVAGVPEKDGCPAVRKPTRSEIINRYCAPAISFGSGSSNSTTYDASIAGIADFAKTYPEAFINVSGYTDSQGGESANQRLSERRAKKVYESLIKAGVEAERITYQGYGETSPIADNSTKEGRELNRRVQVCASTTKRVIETTNTKR